MRQTNMTSVVEDITQTMIATILPSYLYNLDCQQQIGPDLAGEPMFHI